MKASGTIEQEQMRREPIEGAFYAGVLCFAIAAIISTITGFAVQSFPIVALAGLVVSFLIAVLGVVFWVKFKVWRFIGQAK